MSAANPFPSSGIISAFGTFIDGVLDLAKVRLELVSVEVQEEKIRLIQVMIWIAGAMFAATMSLVLASITLVYVFWETARLAVLGGLTAFYVVGLLTLLWQFRRYLERQPKPFAATIAEFERDRACIQATS